MPLKIGPIMSCISRMFAEFCRYILHHFVLRCQLAFNASPAKNDRNHSNVLAIPSASVGPTHDLSVVNYQGDFEKDDSDQQVLWSNEMDKGKNKNAFTYQNVVALLLCWREDCSDLITQQEISRLKSVFEEKFRYKTQTEHLSYDSKTKLQVQINARVAQFVDRNDGPNTLLIVYYAGHGRPGKLPGEMEIFGQTPSNDKKKYLDKIVWNKTESLLEPAEADVLELFDCCCAGNLGHTKGEEPLFEYLAATGFLGSTKVPGDDSFTSALIFALEQLAEKGRFTTVNLLDKIKKDAPNFPDDQNPVLFSRRKNDTRAGRIMLHPLPEEGSVTQSTMEDSIHLNPAEVTLHFEFNEKPPNDRIKKLALEVNELVERADSLGIKRVRWGGMRSGKRSVQSTVILAAEKFRANARRGRMRRQRPSLIITRSPNCTSAECSDGCGCTPDRSTLSPSPSPSPSPSTSGFPDAAMFPQNPCVEWSPTFGS